MIYQRHIPQNELFSAQLEMLMQNSRVATLGLHLAGIFTTLLIFWPFLDLPYLLMWASFFVIFLLVNSLSMSNALVERRYVNSPKNVYRRLLFSAALTGFTWSVVYIYAASIVPVAIQYVFLMVIIVIAAISLGVTGVIREYFIVYLFSSVWPIAWWSLIHYWQQPYNLNIGLFLLLICAVLVSATNRMCVTFENMISMNWEREAISQELGDLTGSLRDRNRQLRDARRQLTDLANVDELTGLGNRRLVNTVLQEEINRARRSGSLLSVIMLDVDYFKNYNDTYGHPAGDEVLQLLADVMQRATSRAGELLGRYGGEEFILILPGASGITALRTATRLRELVNLENILHKTSEVSDHITVSQGLITVRPDSELDPKSLIELADKALYRAKDAGRNAIEVSEVGFGEAGAALDL
ncbi:MAG: diguanylate cyclase (GGDEF)-like protein [Halioglobus sp.]|jgi:diguanylate cyclase (GGDEF)-like protein